MAFGTLSNSRMARPAGRIADGYAAVNISRTDAASAHRIFCLDLVPRHSDRWRNLSAIAYRCAAACFGSFAGRIVAYGRGAAFREEFAGLGVEANRSYEKRFSRPERYGMGLELRRFSSSERAFEERRRRADAGRCFRAGRTFRLREFFGKRLHEARKWQEYLRRRFEFAALQHGRKPLRRRRRN